MSAHGPPPPAAPSGRPDHLLEPARTRTGLALLHHEGSGSPCDVRLKLTREVLTIQKQDVVCVRGSSHGAHSLADSRLCGQKTPTHRGIYVPSVSALGRDETCSQRSAKYLERPGRSPRESVNGRELGLLFTVTPSRAVRDTETVRSITLKPASPTRGSLSACNDTNGHQLKMLQPQDAQNTVLPLISTRVTDSHACAKGAQNRYAAQTACWRLGPERKGRRRAQGPCRHIKDIQRPRSHVQQIMSSEESLFWAFSGDEPAITSKSSGNKMNKFCNPAADQTGMLFVGDAVLQVNGINVEHATHEEVVHLLRNAGDEVAITVDYLREAPAFLKLPLGSPGPAGDHSSGASSPLFDSGLHLNSNPSSTDSPSPSSPAADAPQYEKRWLDTLSVPLSMARISRCKAGTGKCRSGAFQVLAVDGVRTGVLQFHTARESADWLRAVSATISDLTLESMKMVNEGCSPCDQVVHMGWVRERLEGTSSRETFRSKFLALKGSLLYVFSTAPVSTLDWVRAEKTYNLCEVLFKLHKLWLADDGWLHEDRHPGPPGFAPQRPFSFSVLVGHGRSRVFSVDLGSELAAWERSFQRATFKEVQRSRSKTYTCSWQGEMLCFTVDFALGFTCSDSKTKNVLWRFKFSQLKGSSDDGNARVKLLFQHPDTKQIEVKELEFPDLTAVLHCVHAFLAAKVASVDPTFMDSQSFARKSASAER